MRCVMGFRGANSSAVCRAERSVGRRKQDTPRSKNFSRPTKSTHLTRVLLRVLDTENVPAVVSFFSVCLRDYVTVTRHQTCTIYRDSSFH